MSPPYAWRASARTSLYGLSCSQGATIDRTAGLCGSRDDAVDQVRDQQRVLDRGGSLGAVAERGAEQQGREEELRAERLDGVVGGVAAGRGRAAGDRAVLGLPAQVGARVGVHDRVRVEEEARQEGEFALTAVGDGVPGLGTFEAGLGGLEPVRKDVRRRVGDLRDAAAEDGDRVVEREAGPYVGRDLLLGGAAAGDGLGLGGTAAAGGLGGLRLGGRAAATGRLLGLRGCGLLCGAAAG